MLINYSRVIAISLMFVLFGVWVLFAMTLNDGEFLPLPKHAETQIITRETQQVWSDFVTDWPVPMMIKFPTGWQVIKSSDTIKFQHPWLPKLNVQLNEHIFAFDVLEEQKQSIMIDGYTGERIRDFYPVSGEPVDYVIFEVEGTVIEMHGYGEVFDSMYRSIDILLPLLNARPEVSLDDNNFNGNG